MVKKILILFLVIVMLALPDFLLAGETLSLPSLLDEAKKNNPEILAAKKRWEAAEARIPIAKSLEDPQLTLDFEKMKGSPVSFGKAASEDRMLSFSQFLPFFGKLSLKGKIALVESRMFAAQYKDKELEVMQEVKAAYYEFFMKDKELELDEQSLNLLDVIAQIAEAKYRVGKFSQEELFKITTEIARLSSVVMNLKQEDSAAKTQLNALLNRDPENSLGIPVVDENALFDIDMKTLYLLTLEREPVLQVFHLAIEKNQYAHRLAKKSFFPDLMAQITERGFSTGTIGPWDLMLAFTVPLWFWTKQRYEVKEAIANVDEAKAAYEAMKNKALAQTKDLAVKVQIAKNKIDLNKNNVIPVTQSSIEASLAAFRSGRGDLMVFLDSLRMLVDAKMDYYKAVVEYHTNLADLERAVGGDLGEVKK